jgi:hypothetical protein
MSLQGETLIAGARVANFGGSVMQHWESLAGRDWWAPEHWKFPDVVNAVAEELGMIEADSIDC